MRSGRVKGVLTSSSAPDPKGKTYVWLQKDGSSSRKVGVIPTELARQGTVPLHGSVPLKGGTTVPSGVKIACADRTRRLCLGLFLVKQATGGKVGENCPFRLKVSC